MKSMTGYGTTEFRLKSKKISFEVKTVNHRFCEVNLRLPSRFYPLEAELSEFTKKRFSRGRIDIFIRESTENFGEQVKINELQLNRYLHLLKKLSQKVKPISPPHLEILFTLPQVILVGEEQEDLKNILALFKKSLTAVFVKVEKMRQKEGEGLKKEFLKRLQLISKYLQQVEEKIPEMIAEYQTRLKERISKLAQQDPDEWRLAQEVAYFVDRTDVSEEVQRLKSHLQHFEEVMAEKDPVGRKLDFILQEMNREMNTLGSKAQYAIVSKHVVACKHELEKIREQIQNVE